MIIYWAARDLSNSPAGNHHFIIIEFEHGQKGIPPYRTKVAGGRQFITIGAFPDKNNDLVVSANDDNDVQSVKEKFDPDGYVEGEWFDFDLEIHDLDITPPGMTFDELARMLVRLAENFHRNTQNNPVAYSKYNENCSAFVNSILAAAGVSEKDRIRLGEFQGVDWGEEDLLPLELFEPIHI